MSQMETSMCIFPRKIQQRPRGGPAAAPQNVVITTLFCSGGPGAADGGPAFPVNF